MCTFTGSAYTGCVIGGGGPGQVPVCSYKYGLAIQYVGGVPIVSFPIRISAWQIMNHQLPIVI